MAAMTGDRSSLPRLRRAEADLGMRGRAWLAGVSRAS